MERTYTGTKEKQSQNLYVCGLNPRRVNRYSQTRIDWIRDPRFSRSLFTQKLSIGCVMCTFINDFNINQIQVTDNVNYSLVSVLWTYRIRTQVILDNEIIVYVVAYRYTSKWSEKNLNYTYNFGIINFYFSNDSQYICLKLFLNLAPNLTSWTKESNFSKLAKSSTCLKLKKKKLTSFAKFPNFWTRFYFPHFSIWKICKEVTKFIKVRNMLK